MKRTSLPLRRRQFIALIGGAAAWPAVAHAQQLENVPVVGVLHSASPRLFTDAAFAQGLREAGYIERQNVLIEYRWARGAYERLPELAAELVGLRVNIIAAFATSAARVAKAASLNAAPVIPVVFSIGGDPVAERLVNSLNRPGGNVTGVTSIASTLGPKRIELMREFLHDDAALAILINVSNPVSEPELRDAESASRVSGQRIEVLTASNEFEIERAFATIRQRRIGALVITADTFYLGQMQRLAGLAAQYQVPAIGPLREFSVEGGLLSYGASIFEVNRQVGMVVAKALKGAPPSDLPVQQPTKFELVINFKTAKALGLEVPATLLAIADEVIE
jgi:putative ABC transport system substrate-binding protein